MAHTFLLTQTGQRTLPQAAGVATVGQGTVYYRALVDLGNGGVAGIETARARTAPRVEGAPLRLAGPAERGQATGHDGLGAWGQEVREPAAYLVRGDLARTAAGLAAAVGAPADRIIVMYAMDVLLADPGRALDVVVAAKRGGARVLLDNFDLDDPPARFMELLPADILRVDLRRLPWHWDEARRQDTMASLVQFADNLLMDVAAEGVQSIGHRRELKQLGVRYGQGRWRRDTAGILPDPGYL